MTQMSLRGVTCALFLSAGFCFAATGGEAQVRHFKFAYDQPVTTVLNPEGAKREISLQECIVPVVVVRLQMPQVTPAGETVKITYRSDRFTSSVVGLKILLSCGLFESSLTIRLEAFDGTTTKARLVGQAADCDARNPATGEITLQPGETLYLS